VYQFQFAPVPKFPPVITRVVELPVQIGVVPEADEAGAELFTVIVVLTHIVVLQGPSALT
jgi:hypothetical protein